MTYAIKSFISWYIPQKPDLKYSISRFKTTHKVLRLNKGVNMKKILIVEDDRKYADFLRSNLDNENYKIDVVYDSLNGIEFLATNKYDILISGLYLDKINGFQIADTAKKVNPLIKTVILTSKAKEEDEFGSLNDSVDLYVEKQKSMGLILKYIDKLLNTVLNLDKSENLFNPTKEGIVINNNKTVLKDNCEIILTPTEYKLLVLFLENKETLLTRERIIEDVWGMKTKEESRKVDVHIKNLRTKMSIDSIITVRGLGYKWSE